jgi:hydroxymethylglutaryl-CoA lyase
MQTIMGDSCEVRVCEVGLRDGLQLLDGFFPTEEKLAWIAAEAAAGVPEIEVTSLVPARIAPQFRDAEQVVAAARRIPGLCVTVLVPNLRGAERGIELGAAKLNFVMSVSRTHNLKNVRREREESLADFSRIVELRNAQAADRRPRLVASLSTSFGCSYEGRVPARDVTRYAVLLVEAGAQELLLADTVGYGDPAQVRAVLAGVLPAVAPVPVGVHLHDTRGTGLANVAAALECGIRRFDASLAGLGGCPFAPGATGNIVTEDLCFMLDSMGLSTGIDIGKLLAVRAILDRNIPAAELRGAVARAGLPKNYVPARDRAREAA